MIFTSPYPDVEIPAIALTDFVLEHSAEYGDKPALIDGPTGRTYTHAQTADAIATAAGALARRGIGRGDVVALYAPNSPEYVIAFHAVAVLGAVCTTINPIYTVDELAFQLEHAGARGLLAGPDALDRAREAAGRAGVDEVGVDRRAARRRPRGARAPDAPAGPEDLVALPYSSGTTGLPKGVMLTHRNLVANILQSTAQQPVTADDTLVGVLPLFHIYGLNVVMNAVLRNGATLVTVPRFDLEGYLGLVQEHRATKAYLVPPIVLALAKSPVVERYDLSSLTLDQLGRRAAERRVQQAAAERIGCPVVQGYGMTESSPVTHVTPTRPRPPPARLDRATGPQHRVPDRRRRLRRRARPRRGGRGVRARPAGHARLPRRPGGHRRDRRRRRLAAHRRRRPRRRGRLRRPRRPRQGAHQVQGLPGGAGRARGRAARRTRPSPRRRSSDGPTRRPARCPRPSWRSPATATAEEIMAFVAERVAPYKKLRACEFVDEIPKSPSGKILRRVLNERES